MNRIYRNKGWREGISLLELQKGGKEKRHYTSVSQIGRKAALEVTVSKGAWGRTKLSSVRGEGRENQYHGRGRSTCSST